MRGSKLRITLVVLAVTVTVLVVLACSEKKALKAEEAGDIANLINNTLADANSIITEISDNPELTKNKQYLATQLELVVVNQQEYKRLEKIKWGDNDSKKELTRSILVNSEKVLQGYLKGNTKQKETLDLIREEYNTLIE